MAPQPAFDTRAVDGLLEIRPRCEDMTGARRPVRFDLRAAAPDEPWTTFASLSLEAAHAAPATSTVSYDP